MILEQVADWLFPDDPDAWWHEARRLIEFWSPVAVMPAMVAPAGFLASVLALVVLSGVALGSLGVFFVASLALHLLLTQVFGVSVELAVR